MVNSNNESDPIRDNMFKFTMVIPTYWGRDKAEGADEEIVFDHPTMLNEAGTLGRLLESLSIFFIDDDEVFSDCNPLAGGNHSCGRS